MHSMQLCTRNNRSRKTFPVQVLGAPVSPTSLPGRDDAHPSLHIPQHNLGLKKGGGAGRVDQPSRGSLRASFRAQEQDKPLPESIPLWHLASEEGTGQTSLAESNLPLQNALGGRTSQKLQEVPSPHPALAIYASA